MDSVRRHRRAIALIAAYAVALQGLLLAFATVPSTGHAAPFGVICAHDAGDGSGQGQPDDRDLPCAFLCAAMVHGIAAPPPPAIAAAFVPSADVAAAAVATDRAVPPFRLLANTHRPRGPPLA